MIKKPTNPYRLRIKLDLGKAVIGPGKADLLRKVDALGSISAAARKMGINYRRAWFLLDTLNEALEQPIVETTKGGASGGGARLTQTGQALLEAYDHCVEAAERNAEKTLIKFHAIVTNRAAS